MVKKSKKPKYCENSNISLDYFVSDTKVIIYF